MLRSILLSHDENTARIFARVFKDLEVDLEHFCEAEKALAHVSKHRYDAIVVDDQVEQAAKVLGTIIELATCNKSVRIALVDPSAAVDAVFKTGTQVVLYKPLSPERVRHGLRAVRNLMARDRRRGASRVVTMLQARVSPRQARGAAKRVLIADISDSGAAIRSEAGDVPTSGALNLEFELSGTHGESIHTTAELVWQDEDGSAGVRFLDMPSYDRRRLMQWLKEQALVKATAASASYSK
jgi:ActR/RegA family two-component response regulator